jgi:quinoprotein glucose dehydrogenase
VPGEKASPTQPIPTRPAPYSRTYVSTDDLIDFTPELRQEALKLVQRYKIGPIFTPPVVSTWPSPLATLMLPSATGGANWQGGAFDPETKIFYIFTNTNVTPLGLVKADPSKQDFDYTQGIARDPNAPVRSEAGGAGRAGGSGRSGGAVLSEAGAPMPGGGGGRGGEGGASLSVQGLPLIKPPYGRITAIDLNKGEIVWQIAHGDTPDNIKNNPALKGVNIPKTGRQGRIGVLVTKTLAIAGEGGFATQPNGQRGAKLVAYDKMTGNEVGSVYMPAPQTGSPITYSMNGRQYIVLAISGGNYSGELVAFRLPGDGRSTQ